MHPPVVSNLKTNIELMRVVPINGAKLVMSGQKRLQIVKNRTLYLTSRFVTTIWYFLRLDKVQSLA